MRLLFIDSIVRSAGVEWLIDARSGIERILVGSWTYVLGIKVHVVSGSRLKRIAVESGTSLVLIAGGAMYGGFTVVLRRQLKGILTSKKCRV
jgi:hypothetical protein